MIAMKLSSGLSISAQEARIVFQCCLWEMLGGELVKDGWVWAESPCLAALYSPTYVPVRQATEQDQAIWTLLKPTLMQSTTHSQATSNHERTSHV